MAENTNECVIEWVRGGDHAGVTAHSNSRLKSRIEKLAEKFPDKVKIIARNEDGSIFAHVPISYVKINPPRQVSEETAQRASERLKEYYTKNRDNYEDNSPCFE